MKTEFLKDLGLDKEVINKIMAENGKDINAAKAELETTKQNLATTQEELKQTQEQLKTANTTIDGFKDYDDMEDANQIFTTNLRHFSVKNCREIRF